jgi:class 3 adenylate cyclase
VRDAESGVRQTARVPDLPPIAYARSGDVHIAYQTWGSGPHLIGVPPFVQNVAAMWDDPTGMYPAFLHRLGSFATVTHFDKRGTGLSDRVAGGGIEERIDDIRAVMDDVGIERADIGGVSEGGPMAMLFAATYPERVNRLLLSGTAARFTRVSGYACGVTPAVFDGMIAAVVSGWATPHSLLTPMWMPSLIMDAGFRRWVTTYERACASPGSVRDLLRFIRDIDVRSVLAAIQAPTLITHRTRDLVVSVEHGRYLAQHIPKARLIELPGDDHVPWVHGEPLVDAMEAFLTGSASAHVDVDRVLATVLFTDIVDSTRRATELGDAAWRQLLDRHDRVLRDELARHRGVEVKTTGDGLLATFDSPSRAVRAAAAMVVAAAEVGIELRAGLHTGEVERRGDDIAGVAVHVAARVGALARPGEVLVSATVRDLVLGSGSRFVDRGSHALKGVDGSWTLCALDGVC